MCCFSPVTAPLSLLARLFPPRVHVSRTRIFARMADDGDQLLAYSMTLSVAGPVAMILPVPTRPADGEAALRFVDLSSRPRFFDALESLFVIEQPLARKGGLSLGFRAPARPRLVVHRVGAFEASFVPARSEFDRLDPRFRLPDAVWDALGDYGDWGFAVFQLAPGRGLDVHPMAFRFRTRDPARLFFPTVHVHDGRVHPTARFDHALYYQHPDVPSDPYALGGSFRGDAVSFLDVRDDAAGVLVPGARVVRRTLRGRLPNRDTRLDL